jgi:DtxR family transcriptional regulator, Mn-dependent transcriptional regulator
MGDRGKELTSAAEDYLKAVYALGAEGKRATTSALAERMHVSAPSATAMMKRLAELGLVERAPYRGVVLTERGRLCALEVLRHHRLLERYLADSLGMSLDEVHAEADRLEHVLSEELEARIDAALGFPTHDPHGDPIPDSKLRIAAGAARSVADLGPGDSAVVVRVPDGDAELLRYLAEIALVPGEPLELTGSAPFGGPLTVRTGSGEHAIARELAASVGIA